MEITNSMNISDKGIEVTLSGISTQNEVSGISWHIESGEDTFTLPDTNPTQITRRFVPEMKQDGGNLNFKDIDAAYKRKKQMEKIELFLQDLKQSARLQNTLSEPVLSQTFWLWENLREELYGTIPVPVLAAGEDNAILFSFRTALFYLEIEIMHEGMEVYFHDKNTGKEIFSGFEYMDTGLLDCISSLFRQVRSSS